MQVYKLYSIIIMYLKGGNKIMKFDLRQARQYAGLKQEEVARKIGVAKITYQKYEHGERHMRTDKAKKFSEAVNIPQSQIIF